MGILRSQAVLARCMSVPKLPDFKHGFLVGRIWLDLFSQV